MLFKRTLRSALLAVVVASILDVALLFIARAAGVSMIVPHGHEKVKQLMGVSDIVIANALFLGVGSAVYLALAKWTKTPKRWFRVAAAVGFVLLLFPIFQEIDTGTRIALFLMHVLSLGAMLWAFGKKTGLSSPATLTVTT